MIHRIHRFHGRKSLNFVLRRGQVVHGPHLTLKYILNQRSKQYRVAVVVSRKVSKSAVVRNRIRRRIYETVRDIGTGITKPYDLVFLIREAELAKVRSNELQKEVLKQLSKSGVVALPDGSDVRKHDIVIPKEKNT